LLDSLFGGGVQEVVMRHYASAISLVLGTWALPICLAMAQADKAVPDPEAFAKLKGEWKLPEFKDKDGTVAIRLGFPKDRKGIIALSYDAKKVDLGVGVADEKRAVELDCEFKIAGKRRVVVIWDGTFSKVLATISYEIKEGRLEFDTAQVLPFLVKHRPEMKKRWEGLLKEKNKWERVEEKK
jgi:hypothetical protein